MTQELRAQAGKQLQALSQTTNDQGMRDVLRALGDIITIDAISNSNGIAIGRNIRQVINTFNIPPEAMEVLLNLRGHLGDILGFGKEGYDWGSLVVDRTRNFVGRKHIFEAMDRFLGSHRSGYFIIKGDPGFGKSSILAKFVQRTGCIAHFNVRALGITSAAQFLQNICTQIIIDAQLPYSSLPSDATKDGAFFMRVLQEAAKRLPPGERIVIAVDALDEVDLAGHPQGANILFLPNVLPDGVYILLTRRNVELPFVAQAPQEVLDLMTYSTENRQDVKHYLSLAVERPGVNSWITTQGLTVASFVAQFAELSEDNFMYLRYVIEEIENPKGMYKSISIEQLPSGLEGYYDDHWRHMGMKATPLPRIKIRIVYVLCEARQPITRRLIREFATEPAMPIDDLTVQEVIDAWRQFLHEQSNAHDVCYSIYHSSFRDFLHRKDIVQAAGITIEGINASMADNLLRDLYR